MPRQNKWLRQSLKIQNLENRIACLVVNMDKEVALNEEFCASNKAISDKLATTRQNLANAGSALAAERRKNKELTQQLEDERAVTRNLLAALFPSAQRESDGYSMTFEGKLVDSEKPGLFEKTVADSEKRPASVIMNINTEKK